MNKCCTHNHENGDRQRVKTHTKIQPNKKKRNKKDLKSKITNSCLLKKRRFYNNISHSQPTIPNLRRHIGEYSKS